MSSFHRYHDTRDLHDTLEAVSRLAPFAARSNREIIEALYGDRDVSKHKQKIDEVLREIDQLTKSYGTSIRLGKAHPSPCSVWRAERSLSNPVHDNQGRFTNRVHLFAGQRHMTSISDHDTQEKIGLTQRYLGYISLRPLRNLRPHTQDDSTKENFYFRYVSAAMLIPPPYMTRPKYHLLTCVGGPAEGILPFRSAPFFSPTPQGEASDDADGLLSPCMHAALHAGLLLKAGLFHCRPISSIEMATLLWEISHNARGDDLEKIPEQKRNSTFDNTIKNGISLEEAGLLLKHSDVRASAIVEKITEAGFVPVSKRSPTESSALEALRCITDYLSNGIPVIVEVQTKTESGHGVLVIGAHLMTDPDDDRWPIVSDDNPLMRRIDVKELPSRIIVHDMHTGPYAVVTSRHILEKALLKSNSSDESSGYRFLAILPMCTKIGIQHVRQIASVSANAYRDKNEDYISEQLVKSLEKSQRQQIIESINKKLNKSEPRLVTRLIRSRQLVRRYIKSGDSSENMENVITAVEAFTSKQQKNYDDMCREHVKQETSSQYEPLDAVPLHWWCVEVCVPEWQKNWGEMQGDKIPPRAVFIWPLNYDRAIDGPDIPIIIQYAKNDSARIQLSMNLNKTKYEFKQWRPGEVSNINEDLNKDG